MKAKAKWDKITCCICNREFLGYGHNPWPIVQDVRQKCCDDCNNKVIATRMALVGEALDRAFPWGYSSRDKEP